MMLQYLNGTAIVAVAVVFGTDVFFTVVGKKALAQSKDESIADVMGNIHAVADARMPVFGVMAVVTTLLQILLGGFKWPPIVSLIALLLHLIIYLRISKPVNKVMVEGIKFGRLISNIRELQVRWDKMIGPRAMLLFIAIVGLLLINYI
jgi:hypothetical protein